MYVWQDLQRAVLEEFLRDTKVWNFEVPLASCFPLPATLSLYLSLSLRTLCDILLHIYMYDEY